MRDEDEVELGEWEFIGRRGTDPVRLVPGEVIAAVPEARRLAEQSGRDVSFDYLDDGAVLRMLRLRHEDEQEMFTAGFRTGVPLALIGFGGAVYWGGVAQYWESDRARLVYLAAAGIAVLLLLGFWIRAAVRHWGDPARQNVRARAKRYREVAHVARGGGAAIPSGYPHYGPYPFAATYRHGVEERDRDGRSEA
ncbi:hypothetical protein ACFWA1_13435 [Streptomyces sp. NPDC060005]|uniref:hypothetical protein n=1 Tax=Streptomyces sp. NPDC060005 TaxID=3347034 RepID=UPI00369367FA